MREVTYSLCPGQGRQATQSLKVSYQGWSFSNVKLWELQDWEIRSLWYFLAPQQSRGDLFIFHSDFCPLGPKIDSFVLYSQPFLRTLSPSSRNTQQIHWVRNQIVCLRLFLPCLQAHLCSCIPHKTLQESIMVVLQNVYRAQELALLSSFAPMIIIILCLVNVVN